MTISIANKGIYHKHIPEESFYLRFVLNHYIFINNAHNIFNGCVFLFFTVCLMQEKITKFDKTTCLILTKHLTGDDDFFSLTIRWCSPSQKSILCWNPKHLKDVTTKILRIVVVHVAQFRLLWCTIWIGKLHHVEFSLIFHCPFALRTAKTI